MATMESILPQTPPEGGLLGRAQYWFACLFALGWTGVCGAGLFVQLALGEQPCPLCVVQRMLMLLAATGAAYIVRTALTHGVVTGRDYMTGWGLALVAVAVGSFASWRQAVPRVLPGGRGHGGEVLGLHLGVWAWVLFQASAVAVGIVLACAHATAGRAVPTAGPGPHRAAGLLALWLLGLVAAVSVVAVFLQEGLHWVLPDDPRRYEFFHDLRILGG
ncbi:disulfide bond formation protein B [Streptomyces sp. BR123]|uniref:disulfide bond formation protein B n=1 Tax=Streptomyces sp. BR123 TaxID=2749828 RepID=UPI0015C4E542|nr:disulfide bond formation protein B [Streptomyces sp. BR123]NXY97359.1 disulfide bond formation protein B [Streptomyces sp. BR123]